MHKHNAACVCLELSCVRERGSLLLICTVCVRAFTQTMQPAVMRARITKETFAERKCYCCRRTSIVVDAVGSINGDMGLMTN